MLQVKMSLPKHTVNIKVRKLGGKNVGIQHEYLTQYTFKWEREKRKKKITSTI